LPFLLNVAIGYRIQYGRAIRARVLNERLALLSAQRVHMELCSRGYFMAEKNIVRWSSILLCTLCLVVYRVTKYNCVIMYYINNN